MKNILKKYFRHLRLRKGHSFSATFNSPARFYTGKNNTPHWTGNNPWQSKQIFGVNNLVIDLVYGLETTTQLYDKVDDIFYSYHIWKSTWF